MKASRYIIGVILFITTSSLTLSAQLLSITDVSTTPTECSDGTEGSISFNISGGTPPYIWYIYEGGGFPVDNGGPTTSTSITSNGRRKLSTYLIAVVDAMGNPAYMTAVVDGPDPMQITSYSAFDITCNNADNGIIEVSATGESGSHIYDLSGPVNSSNTDGNFTGLPAGVYTVTAMDDGTCTSTDITPSLTINNPSLVTAVADNITDAGCFGEFSGSIAITPSGGTPSGAGTGYTYLWSGPSGFSSITEDINNLEAGDYFVNITDGNDCSSMMGPYTVGSPSQITVALDGSSNVLCNGESNGTVSITTSGGSGGYIYSWIGALNGLVSSDEDPVNLVADEYRLVVEDASGCTRNFDPFITITEPDVLGIQFNSTQDANCNGESNGSAEITPLGGTTPYTFAWSGPGYTSSEEDPTGMAAGTYSVTISDANGCTQIYTDILTIGEPPVLVVSLDDFTDVSCFGGSDGEALVTASGGTPPYIYAWIGATSGYTSGTEDPDDLPPDNYQLVVTDDHGCSSVNLNFVTIGEPAQLMVTTDLVTHVDCNGEATGAIDITPAGGTPAYGFAWSGPNGFTANTEDITGLAVGSYSLTLTDSHGCSRDFTDLVTITENTAISATSVITDLNCGEPIPSNDGAIDATILGGTPGYTFYWTGPNSFTAFTEDISGLEPGTYVLEVTDALGCIQTMTAQVGTPAPLVATTTQVNIDCYGAGNGSIDLTVSGGTIPYAFAWTGPGSFTENTEDITNLEAGAYSVTVTYFNGCSVPFNDIATITEAAELQISSVKTDISCGGLSDGAIDVTVSGGTLPYLYAWSGPGGFLANTEDINGLAAGSYSLMITDGAGCVIGFPDVETIIEPSSVIASYVSHMDVLCYGDAGGSIEIDVIGGIPPYSFNWVNSSGTSISDLEDPGGLPADTYSLHITDGNGCMFSFADLAIVSEPPLLEADLAKTDVSCFGIGDGSITVNATGGFGAYEYSTDGSTYQAAATFTPLAPGFYTIWTRDANLCVASDTITILQPSEIIILEEIATYLCHGDNLGEISINEVSGGIPPYRYSINAGVDFYDNPVFSNLAPGSYQTVVIDADGCTKPGMLNVLTEPSEIQIDTYGQIDVSSCYDAAEGSISITGSGGTGSISYSLNGAPPVSSGEFLNLMGGSYTITLIDDNDCTLDTIVEILTPTPLIITSITVTAVTGCAGDTNGSLEVFASGGTGSLEFSLDDVTYQPGTTFSALGAGTYIVWVRDANGCTDTDTATITEPVPVTATIEKTDAIYGALGTISISDADGGTPPYTYSINGLAGPFTGTTTYIDLLPAMYHVIVMDQGGCTYADSVEILDTPPLAMDITVIHVSCFGADDGSIEFIPGDAEGNVQYSIDSGQNFQAEALFENLAGDSTYHLVALDDAGKLFTGTATILEPAEIALTHTVTPAECNAFSETGAITLSVSGGTGSYSYLWSDGSTEEDRSNILSGIYEVTVTDENNCSQAESINVVSEVTVEAYAGEDTTICYGEAIQLQGSMHGIPSWDPSEFLEDLTIPNPQTTPITEPTTFVLTITETASIYACFNKDSISVDLHPLSGLTASADTFVISGNSVQLEAQGGPFEMYRWEPETGLDNATAPDPIATPLEPIRYYVYASNEYGCEEVDSVFVDVLEDINAYNAFSPNGDGINDFFEIRNSERFPEMLVEVYSRWGDLLYSSSGYDSSKQWDGTTRGKEAPVGTYYYVIVPYPGAKIITGNVTIIR